jgi:hypothetical protein
MQFPSALFRAAKVTAQRACPHIIVGHAVPSGQGRIPNIPRVPQDPQYPSNHDGKRLTTDQHARLAAAVAAAAETRATTVSGVASPQTNGPDALFSDLEGAVFPEELFAEDDGAPTGANGQDCERRRGRSAVEIEGNQRHDWC